jgi:antitoxin component YwqK of YwqJK toxin-antitoxin module
MASNKHVFYILIIGLLNFACGPEEKKETQGNSEEILVPAEEKDKLIEKVDYHSNGQLKAKGTTLNGKKMGLWVSWYENGLKWSETTFQNDIKEGTTKSWYPTGILRYTGKFSSDKKSAFWVFYDETGKEASKIDYDNPGVTDYNKQLRDTMAVKKK